MTSKANERTGSNTCTVIDFLTLFVCFLEQNRAEKAYFLTVFLLFLFLKTLLASTNLYIRFFKLIFSCSAHVLHNSLQHGTDVLKLDVEVFSVYTVKTEALKTIETFAGS